MQYLMKTIECPIIFIIGKNVLTNSESEVVEGVFVDDVKLPNQSKGKFHHSAYVHVLPVVLLWGVSLSLASLNINIS